MSAHDRVIRCLAGALAWLFAAGASAEPVALMTWIDADAGPFFADKLATHPRFSGERVRLVAMQGDRVLDATDGLTARLQAQLADRLLKRSGVRLAWQPGAGHASFRPTANGFDCLADADVGYLLGVEIEPLAGQRHRVSLRILDTVERHFVSGAARQWTGRLDGTERRLFTDPSEVSAAAGTRARPFELAERDGLAATLARSLACQLSQRRAGDVSVFIAPGETGAAVDATLLAQYLAAQREIRLAGKKDEADLVLAVEAHSLEPGLDQVWARLAPLRGDAAVPGVGASVYARSRATATVAEQTPRRTDRGAGSRDAAITPDPAAAPARVRQAALLERPRVIVPRHPALCRTRDPWRRGAVHAADDGDVAGAGCFAVAVDASRDTHLYVIARLDDGGLVRLPPDGCDARTSRGAAAIIGSGRLQFPRGGRVAALPVWSGERVETLILLAAASDGDPGRLRERVRTLPSACTARTGQHRDEARWIARTEAVMATLGTDADWQALAIRHGR